MAKCEWGIPGILSGALGDVVICRGKYGLYVRRRVRTSSNLPSVEQHTHRRRFAACVLFFCSLEAHGMADSWKKAARRKNMRASNLFIRRNLTSFNAEGQIADFDRLRLTEGCLEFSPGFRVSGWSGESLEVEWLPEELPWRGDRKDCLRAVVMTNGGSYEVYPADTGDARRKDCRAVIRFPSERMERGHLFLYFEAEDGGDFSPAKHIEF